MNPLDPPLACRIAHFSDLHYSATHLEEADRCFGFAIDAAITAGVDCAILSGDSTDHGLEVRSPAFLALMKRVQQLANHCPVLMLQGTFSHEPLGALRPMGLIDARFPVRIVESIEVISLVQDHWVPFAPDALDQVSLVVSAIPTLNKADLAVLVGEAGIAAAMGDHLAHLLAQMAPMHEYLRGRGIPTVLVSHGMVDGAHSETGVPMASADHEFHQGALFAARATATMLGHIHLHQAWQREHLGTRQIIAYPGSIGRFHYGEIGDKMALLWQVGSHDCQFTPVVTPSKKMIDLRFEGEPDRGALERVAPDCQDAWVRIQFEVLEEDVARFDTNGIIAWFKQHGAREVQVKRIVIPVLRSRVAGISRLPLADKLLAWAKHTQVDITGLPERLVDLQQSSAEDLVALELRKICAVGP